MKHPRILLGLTLGLLLVISTTAGGQAAGGQTSIVGTVLDATAGATLPNGLVARLRGVSANGALIPEQTADVDTRGRFAFDGVAIGSSFSYAVRIDYGGATYETAVPAAVSPPVPIALTIYEPTTSDAALQIDAATWVVEGIDPDNQQLTVLETIVLNNVGDRTFIGDHHGDPGSDAPGVLPRTLRILLPPGASGFAAQLGIESSTTLPVANGVVDTQPITPGPHQIGYTYNIAYSEGGAEIRKAMPYLTRKLRCLVPNAGLDLRSDRLMAGGSVQIASRPYLILAADDVPANSVVTVDIFGLPSSPVGRLDPNTIQIAGLVMILLAVFLAIYLALRPTRSAAAEVEAERQNLIASIASLDDAYARGTLADDVYRDERDRHKRQVVDLMVGDRGLANRPGGQG